MYSMDDSVVCSSHLVEQFVEKETRSGPSMQYLRIISFLKII